MSVGGDLYDVTVGDRHDPAADAEGHAAFHVRRHQQRHRRRFLEPV